MLASYHSIIIMVDATHFHSESCYAFLAIPIKHATRKLKNTHFKWLKNFFSFDGTNFKSEASSQFSHYYALALGSYRNSPFVTGENSGTNGLKTEILDYQAGEWKQAAEFPFSNLNRCVQVNYKSFTCNSIFSISCYTTASTDESVYIIGGYTNGSPSYISTIAEYKDGDWKNVGNLRQGRHRHGAITSGPTTMVVGGYPNGGSS